MDIYKKFSSFLVAPSYLGQNSPSCFFKICRVADRTSGDADISSSASDIVNYKLPTDKLRELDIARLKQLQKDPRYNTEFWQSEIKKMLELGKKAEQQAFAKYGLAYVVKEYLPAKLKEVEGQ